MGRSRFLLFIDSIKSLPLKGLFGKGVRRFMDLSLSIKTNVITIGLALLLFIVIGYFIIGFISSILLSSAKDRADSMALLFVKINALPFEVVDYYALENNARELLKDKDIVVAEVYDADNFKITFASKERTSSDERIYYKWNKINDKYGHKAGSCRIGFSLESTYRQISEATLAMLLALATALTLIAVSVRYMLRTTISRPLGRLLDSVNIVSGGDLSYQMKVETHDEIGELSRSFNEMTTKLRSSRSLTRNIVDAMPSILITLDREGNVIHWNQSAELSTGIKNIEVIGKNLFEKFPQFLEYKKSFDEVISSANSLEMFRVKLPGDEKSVKNVSMFPLVEEGVKGVVIRVDDITEIENKENQIKQMQKMESISSLAGGIAHDFNNVLGGIVGTVSILKYHLDSKKKIEEVDLLGMIDVVESSANRATDMVKQLLTLSRKQEFKLAPTDINISVKHVVNLCNNSFDKSIEIKVTLLDVPAMVEADPTQMEQVLLNICINASHAMTIMRKEGEPVGGKLTINIKKIFPDKHFCDFHPGAVNIPYVVVTISDTGIGMSREIMGKIFEPFFTTKEKDSGTGLGLAMAYNIVHEHRGFIDVYSEVGVGSTFNIYIPYMEEYTHQEVMTDQSICKGSGTILLIDDEDVIRRVATDILKECGYEVLLAENGKIGIEVFKENMEQISLVILDMAMPVMSGKETFVELKRIKPDVKVIMASGFKQDKRVIESMELGVNSFIQKPFTMYELAKVIDDVIKK